MLKSAAFRQRITSVSHDGLRRHQSVRHGITSFQLLHQCLKSRPALRSRKATYQCRDVYSAACERAIASLTRGMTSLAINSIERFASAASA